MQSFYQQYAQNLKKSKIPIVGIENERLIKYYLGSFSKDPIYVLGSSRSLQINQTLLKEQQPLTNLSVSGGSFEDFLLFLGMLLQKKRVPQKIYLVIDPWFFSKNADIRHMELFDFYDHSLSFFNFVYEGSRHYLLKEKTKNIFNKNYFYYNLSSLYPKKGNLLILETQSYNADGTLNYSEVYEKNTSLPNIHKIEDEFNYKFDHIHFSPDIVKKFCTVINLSKARGIEFSFIVLPYHPNISHKRFLGIKNKIIYFFDSLKFLSKDLGVPLYGNVIPDGYNLRNEDYYDGIHLKKSGLSKFYKIQ